MNGESEIWDGKFWSVFQSINDNLRRIANTLERAEKIEEVIAKLNEVIERTVTMAGELQALRDEVAAIDGVVDSAVVLLQGIEQRMADLIANGGTPADFEALRAQLQASREELAAAVAAVPPPA